MAQIDAFFKLMNDEGASDLHMVADQQPVLRIRGDMERVKFKVMKHDELKAMLYEVCPEAKIKVFEETGDIDFGYEIPGLARYRCNFFNQKNGIGAVFREIPSDILSVEQLGLPKVISRLAHLPKGLVLVTGPTGHGKSTTLAAIIDVANRTRTDHIITVEDPIEYRIPGIGQVQVNPKIDLTFAKLLRSFLRLDPDVILVGELRDADTIMMAMTAAETGHLVFGTLHTTGAVKTIDRIIDALPGELREQTKAFLAMSLKAVVTQVLCKTPDGRGRRAVLEILVNTPHIAELILNGGFEFNFLFSLYLIIAQKTFDAFLLLGGDQINDRHAG